MKSTVEPRARRYISLPTVTLICVTGVNFEDSVFALWRSSLNIKFASVKIVSPTKPRFLPSGIVHEETINSELNSIDSYSHYMIYDLWRHVTTDFCLIVQADGYVLNPQLWTDDFLNYDYIGAPWRLRKDAYIDPFGNQIRVGNGGFSLRSKKLLAVPNTHDIPWDVNSSDFYKHMDVGLFSEDGNICVHNRHIFEAAGCVWAPLEIAIRFSKEQRIAEKQPGKTFGFHKKIPNKLEAFRDRLLRYKFNRLEN